MRFHYGNHHKIKNILKRIRLVNQIVLSDMLYQISNPRLNWIDNKTEGKSIFIYEIPVTVISLTV